MGLPMTNLMLLRKERRLSQKDLAQAIGVAQNTVSQWENGEREPDNAKLIELARYFDASIDYLLGGTVVRRPIETTAAHLADPRRELSEEAQRELDSFLAYIIDKDRKRRGLT
jgi:transcriptional regulator with XRE-family HTH domain